MEHYQQRYLDSMLLRASRKSVITEDELRLYQLNALQQLPARSAQTVSQPLNHDHLLLPEPVKVKENVISAQVNGECALDLTVSTKKRPLDEVCKENVQVKHARYTFPATQHGSQKTGFLQHSRIDLANQSNYIPNGHLDKKQTVENMLYSPRPDINQEKCRSSAEPTNAQNIQHSFNSIVCSGDGHIRHVLEHSRDSHQNLHQNQHRLISGKRMCNQSIELAGQVKYVSFHDTHPALTTHNIPHGLSTNKGHGHHSSPNSDYKHNVLFADSNIAQRQQTLQHPMSKKSVVATSTCTELLYRQNMLHKNKTLSLSADNNFHRSVSIVNTTQHSPSHKSYPQTLPYKDMIPVQPQSNLQYYHSNHIEAQQPEPRGILSTSTSIHTHSQQTPYAPIVNNSKPKTGTVHHAFPKSPQPTFSKLIQQYHSKSVSNNANIVASQQPVKSSPTLDKYISEQSSNKTMKSQHHSHQPQTNNSAPSSKLSVGETLWNKQIESSSPRRNSSTTTIAHPDVRGDKLKSTGNNLFHNTKIDRIDRHHVQTVYENMATVEKRIPSPRSDCFSMLNDEPIAQPYHLLQRERNYKNTKLNENFTKMTFPNVSSHFNDIQAMDGATKTENKKDLTEKLRMQCAPKQIPAPDLFPCKNKSPCEFKLKQEDSEQTPLENMSCQRNAKSVIFDLLTKSNDKTPSDEQKDTKVSVIEKQAKCHEALQRELELSKDTVSRNTEKQASSHEFKEIITNVNTLSETPTCSNIRVTNNFNSKPRVSSSSTIASVGVPFSKKRIILDAVSKDKDLCRFIEDTSCARTVSNVGFNPDSPEMPTLSPQQKLSNSCTISPNLNEPPVLECLDSDTSDKSNVTTKTKNVLPNHSTNSSNNSTTSVLSDSKGFFKRDTFPRRPSINKIIPVANVAPMIKNKNTEGDDITPTPEGLITDPIPIKENSPQSKTENDEGDTLRAKSTQLELDIKHLRSMSKKKRRAAARTKRTHTLNAERQKQQAVKLRSRSDLQRTIRRLKRSTRSDRDNVKETSEDISGRITRSNHSIRPRRSTGCTLLPRYNRNAAYENELKNEQKRNAQRKLKPRRRIRIVYSSREEEDNLSEKDGFLNTEGDENTVETTNVSPSCEQKLGPKTVKARSPRTWAQKRGTKRRIRRHFTPRGCARIVQKSEYDTLDESTLTTTARRSLFNEFDASEFSGLYGNKGYDEFVRLQGDIRSLVVNKSLGETLLHKAVRVGNEEIVEYCLERDLHNVNAKDNAGYTPLHEACVTGNQKIAFMLLKNGSDINACSQDGIRPIHDAVENHHVSIVRLLLKYGADPTLSNYAGKSPLKLAKTHQMYTFLSGCLDDLNGTEDGVDMWQFSGSSVLDTERESEIFVDMPSDPEDESEDVFQFDDFPHFSTVRVNCEKEQSSKEYVCIDDILSYYNTDYDAFQTIVNDCKPFDVVVIPRDELSDTHLNDILHIPKLNSNQSDFQMVLKSQWTANSSMIHSKLAEHRKLNSLNSTELSDVQNNNTIVYDKEIPSKITYNRQQSVAVAPTVRPSVIKLMNRTNSTDGLLINNTNDTDLLKITPENKFNSDSAWITSDCYEVDHFRFKVGNMPDDCFDLKSSQTCLKKYTALVRPCKDNPLMSDTGSLLDVTF